MTDSFHRLFLLFSVISLFALVLFGWDKLMAKLGRSRIPEFGLLAAALLGGGTGALLGMLLFRHKIRKPPFPVLIPLFFLLQCLLLALTWSQYRQALQPGVSSFFLFELC